MGIDISIVIPVWNEEENIRPLCSMLRSVMKRTRKSYEVIFVDDGSTDYTHKAITRMMSSDRHIRAVRFRTHCGKSDALSSGFSEAMGRLIITMDGDLQDDPKEIPNFLRKINEGYDMVVGWKFKRHDPLTKRLPSKLFNWLTARLTGLRIHDSNCCFKIMKSSVAKDIDVYGELHRYIPALAHMKGYNVAEMKVNHRPRLHGRSKYGFSRLVKGMLDLITIKFLMSYAKRPMHLFGSMGIISFAAGLVISLYMLLLKLLYNSPIGERPLLLLGVLLLVIGVQFVSLGLLGEMIVGSKRSGGQRL
jgi:glycosyltransferase involved in cell wall biosynthesis